ncbi:MAG: long-chain acyl-CoA synthetase [Paraglaciecola psychrophila]|jgi:long-chain acyl-CoA synthetase
MSMYNALQQVWTAMTAKDAPFEIAKINVRGQSLNSYRNAPPSVREVWLSTAQFAERDYLVYGDERWTYAQAHSEVAAIAAWLRKQGIAQGDRVAIAMRNYPEWMLCYWACLSQGIAVVGVNAWWIASELEYGLADSNPKLIICDQERLERFNEVRSNFPDMTVVGVRLTSSDDSVIPFSELTRESAELPDAIIDGDEDACIFYTSGTTGKPKGAQLTHRGCVTNLMNLAFGGAVFSTASALANGLAPPNPEDAPISSALVTTPLFHVTANNCLAYGTTFLGGKLVHMYKWDAGEALRLIEKEGITTMSGVPTMSREVINHPDFAKYDTSTVLSMGGGGAQLPPDLVGKIDQSIATARPNTGFGMTETCGIITSFNGDFFVAHPDSAGPAMPSYEAKCIDTEGRDLGIDEVGELLVRGAAVIKGYLNREDATAESIVDGWLYTGDVARIDKNGFIFIVDRIKDMVLRGGENIYCAEVEAVVYSMDGIAECSVFGVDDERLGEEVGTAIVLKPGATQSAEQIRDFCLANSAKHKVPRYIWIQDQPLPTNASGKFLKRELRKTLDTAEAS